MARDYGKVSSTFWTGDTGRAIRARGGDAQRVAMYLMTCPMSNMIGLYYLPLPVICHEVGLTQEAALKALQSLSEVGFANWCSDLEHVFVREMAAWQIGEPLKEADNKVSGIIKEWQSLSKCKFYHDFYERYAASFHLPPPSKPKAPSKPLRSQEQEQEQEIEQEQEQEKVSRPRTPAITAAEVQLPSGWQDTPEVRAALHDWLEHKHAKGERYKSVESVGKMLTTFANRYGANAQRTFLESVPFSIGNNYSGCFAPKDTKQQPDRTGDGQRHNPQGTLAWRNKS